MKKICFQTEEWEQGLKNAEESLKCARLLFDKNDPTIGWSYNDKAVCELHLNMITDAEKDIYEAEKKLMPIYGNDSFEYATLLHNKGYLFLLQQNYKQARILLIQARDLQIKTKGEAIPNTLKYLEDVEQSIKESL